MIKLLPSNPAPPRFQPVTWLLLKWNIFNRHSYCLRLPEQRLCRGAFLSLLPRAFRWQRVSTKVSCLSFTGWFPLRLRSLDFSPLSSFPCDSAQQKLTLLSKSSLDAQECPWPSRESASFIWWQFSKLWFIIENFEIDNMYCILSWVELCSLPTPIYIMKSWPPGPLNVTFLGDRVFAEVIRSKWGP